ncbi:MAG: 4Fe-4S binding protein [Dehalococcoidia bacterium]
MKRFRVRKDLCQACGRCAMTCFRGAISLESGVACIDQARCNGCGLCVTVCTQGAILAAESEPVDLPRLIEEVYGLRAETEKIIDRIGKLKR